MPIESAPYYFAVCDCCGERADYGEYTAWLDPDTAGDLAEDWTERDGVWHCPACPSLAAKDDDDE